MPEKNNDIENRPGRSRAPASRRDFLAATASAGAGMFLARAAAAQDDAEAEAAAAPAEASAEAPAAAPSADDLNVALIGMGAQGMVLMNACLKIPGIRFKAVCDIWSYSQRRGSGTLRKFGHEVNVYEDFRELLDTEQDLDAAIVATPDFMHAEHAIGCMRAGLHVYCEKEMSNDLEKARQMVLASRETGKLLQIGHQRRSNPRYKHAIDRLLRDEALVGRVTHGYGQWNRAKSEDLGWPNRYTIDQATLEKYGFDSMQHFRNWRWYKKYGGGPIVDLGSHQIDIFNWVFGSNPKSVSASGGVDFYPDHEWYDNVMAVYEYDTPQGTSRAFYQVLTTTSNGGFYETFMGEDGTLVISEVPQRGNHFLREAHADQERWSQLAKNGDLVKYEEEPAAADKTDVLLDVRVSKPLGAWDLPIELNKPVHQPHLENFFDAIRMGTPLNCPAEVGYETAVEVLRVNDAVELACKVEFKPEDFVV
ncbi:MAG: Gfo/Idh/MocA family oxidoreductase [Candidatus Hydrogenedentes bacterium]|nr:Gfo/Idh/MocA family oxidoreductase [Candidatus Hydrogenedentota bacterium]